LESPPFYFWYLHASWNLEYDTAFNLEYFMMNEALTPSKSYFEDSKTEKYSWVMPVPLKYL
jgi:hypothetical protein